MAQMFSGQDVASSYTGVRAWFAPGGDCMAHASGLGWLSWHHEFVLPEKVSRPRRGEYTPRDSWLSERRRQLSVSPKFQRRRSWKYVSEVLPQLTR